jgi:phytol kinase
MNKQLLWLGFFLLLLLILIIISELLHKKLRWPPEQSRKFLHVSGGLMCLLFPKIFSSHWYVLALSLIAFIILLITYQRKLLQSVHKTKRYSVGSVLFPIPVYLCFLTAELKAESIFFYLPVSLLAIADTAAEIGGYKWGSQSKQFFNGQKTLAGSLSFFITAVLVCGVWLGVYNHSVQYIFITGGLIVLLSTIAETVTLHGWDNLTVPAVTIGVLLASG